MHSTGGSFHAILVTLRAFTGTDLSPAVTDSSQKGSWCFLGDREGLTDLSTRHGRSCTPFNGGTAFCVLRGNLRNRLVFGPSFLPLVVESPSLLSLRKLEEAGGAAEGWPRRSAETRVRVDIMW